MARLKTGKRGATNAHILADESISWNKPCKNHTAKGKNTTGMIGVRMGDANNTIVFCSTKEEVAPTVAKMEEYLTNRIPNLLSGKATVY